MDLRWFKKEDGTTVLQVAKLRDIDPQPNTEPLISFEWEDVPIVLERRRRKRNE